LGGARQVAKLYEMDFAPQEELSQRILILKKTPERVSFGSPRAWTAANEKARELGSKHEGSPEEVSAPGLPYSSADPAGRMQLGCNIILCDGGFFRCGNCHTVARTV
jgi:hypothetical protein